MVWSSLLTTLPTAHFGSFATLLLLATVAAAAAVAAVVVVGGVAVAVVVVGGGGGVVAVGIVDVAVAFVGEGVDANPPHCVVFGVAP